MQSRQSHTSSSGLMGSEAGVFQAGQNHFPGQKENTDNYPKQVSLAIVPAKENLGRSGVNGPEEEGQSREIAELRAKYEKLEQKCAALQSDLNRKNESLGEARIALQVVLNKRDEAAQEVRDKILFNIEKFVVPYVHKLQLECAGELQKNILKIIQNNLQQITSSFAYMNKDDFAKFTPTQLQVMDLIKYGHTTKEIAAILNLSPSTVACHRQEIRKRLSLDNRKINLYTALNLQAREPETR